MVEQRDGFDFLITHEKDEFGNYKATRIDVRHIKTGDSTTFWSNQLESLSATLERWESQKKAGVQATLS